MTHYTGKVAYFLFLRAHIHNTFSPTHQYTFRVLEVRVTVDPSIAHIPISGIEDVCQFTGLEWAWHSSYEDGLASINWLHVVHDVITVGETPGPDLNLQL